jgi:hypothetical protein
MPVSLLPSQARTRGKGYLGVAVSVLRRALWSVVSQVTRPLATAAGRRRAQKFRQAVLTQMRLTIANLHPEVVIGAIDRKGEYTEIHLNFRDFRIRITRAIYNRHRQDLWAEIGSRSDPSAFFRLDFVTEAIRRLDRSDNLSELSKCPATLTELDAVIWAAHKRLAQHLCAGRYDETRRMVKRVMHNESTTAQGRPSASAK